MQCTKEQFLKNAADHKMTVIKDDGVHRHLRFSRDKSSVYHFDLITWPGHLCITGDCGTYVFSRIPDMFEFFRLDRKRDLPINPRYWGEKLLSVDKSGGCTEFCEETFKERVTYHYNAWVECGKPRDEDHAKEVWSEIEDQVLSRSDESQAYDAVHQFYADGFEFVDFFDGGGTTRYTFHYLWCLYAIVWGIGKYDEALARPLCKLNRKYIMVERCQRFVKRLFRRT